jgi:hypothetical protein
MLRFLLAILSLSPSLLRAQYSEIGPFLTGSFYFGELNTETPFKNTHLGGGLVYRYNFNYRWAFKVSGLYGKISGSDAQSPFLVERQRNLSFQSTIYEGSAQLEFNFLPYEIGNKKMPFSPYMFGGLSVFNFNPKTSYNNEDVKLRDFGTEGQGTSAPQGKKYAKTQVSIPFGMGFKVNLVGKFGLAVEWGLRKTYTDYLDDISSRYPSKMVMLSESGATATALSDRSTVNNNPYGTHTGYQRGNSKNNDWYSFAGIMIVYKLSSPEPCPGVTKPRKKGR